MSSNAVVPSLSRELPVLFAYIGWANFYDGTESVSGNFAWLAEHPDDNAEASAFVTDDGYFYCGVGRGALGATRLHVVFVAKDPKDGVRKVVGIYASAQPRPGDGGWMNVRTRLACRFPLDDRPVVDEWPGLRESEDGLVGLRANRTHTWNSYSASSWYASGLRLPPRR
jgi:hypothetical protein